MDKQKFTEFVDTCKECGIEDYVVRCEGGNRVLYNDGVTSLIFIKEDYIECLEYSRNHEIAGTGFNIIRVPFGNIDTIKTTAVPFEKTLELMKKLGYYESDPRVKEFIQNSVVRRNIVPGTANLDAIRDNEGEAVLPKGSPGYVVK